MNHQAANIPRILLAAIGTTGCWAFPPAPYYTLYGTVRDQVGQAIEADGAELLILNGDKTVARATIRSAVSVEGNYDVGLRIDQNRPGTALYTRNALPAEQTFRVAVLMNGQWFYPIEASGDLRVGKGGERVKLDLNLGEDQDGDGLPDIWEQWQLFQAGILPDDEGAWPLELLNRNGDFDKDGQSDLMEYLTGTFATDASETFELEIKERQPEHVRFEFFAITGKTYFMERSTDGQTWRRVPFVIEGSNFPIAKAFKASRVGILPATVESPHSDTKEFFRLIVR